MPRVKSKTLNLRIDPALKEAAEQAAAEERRSLTSYIRKPSDDDLRKRGSVKTTRRPAKRDNKP
jgi:predicted HicB family RNase H-like nuclease